MLQKDLSGDSCVHKPGRKRP